MTTKKYKKYTKTIQLITIMIIISELFFGTKKARETRSDNNVGGGRGKQF